MYSNIGIQILSKMLLDVDT